MNISYNWLKDLIETGYDADETARQLTRVGLAVEGIHPHKDDFVLDIDLTSNRPDCLSHLGVARELGVVSRKTIEHPLVEDEATIDGQSLVTLDAQDLCSRFTARVIRGVKVGPSPQWLVDRLEAIGERSINNIADITNYVMLELGQPMHAFDLDKLSGNRIVVRRARNNESITTLDEVERDLNDSMIAICDAEKPAAIGGIMGGFNSSITESTANVILEVACFNRSNIRNTSRRLNLATEASYRFERGVDIQNIARASNRAANLICELAGGELCEFVDIFPAGFVANQIHSADIATAVAKLTGLEVTTDECLRILDALGITASDDKKTFESPSWRHDIAIEEDLVEEIARHVGYENIQSDLPPSFGAGEYQPNEHRERKLRQTLSDLGFDEAISFSFIDTRHDANFEPAPGVFPNESVAELVTLQDSVIEGAIRMRPSVVPGLLDAVRLNLNHQRRDIKLFEIGKVFSANSGDAQLPHETEIFGLAITGGYNEQDRAAIVRAIDFYDAKGAMEAALDAVGVNTVHFSPVEIRHMRKGQSASIKIDGRSVGSLGRLSDEIASTYKFRQPVYVAEVNMTLVLSLPAISPIYTPLAKYPGITRDVSFLADRSVVFADIRSAVAIQGYELCRSIQFVDVYEGKGLSEGERAITIRLEYRSDDGTLVEEEVETIHQQILAAVEKTTGVSRRI